MDTIEELDPNSNGIVVAEEQVDFQPRPYQNQLAEICIKKNTIVYLPTGAGKTHIALMVIKHFAKDLQTPLSEGGRRSVFVVNTVALARQQSESLCKSTSLRVSLYTGDMNVDTWARERWRDEFEQNQIIVATCQIIVDIISTGYLSVGDFNVVVLDECHSARGDHPMHQLMSKFQYVAKSRQPRVIGLTGMLLQAPPSAAAVEPELLQLENTLQGTIATVAAGADYDRVLEFSTDPQEKVILYTKYPSMAIKSITAEVEAVIEVLKTWRLEKALSINPRTMKCTEAKKIRDLSKLLKDFIYQLDDFGIYGGSIAILAVLIELELDRRQCESTAERNLVRFAISAAEKIRHKLVQLMAGFETEYEQMINFSSDKLRQLVRFLETYLDHHPEAKEKLKCLVFVQRRHSAKCVYHILKRIAGDNFPIRPDFMVGRNAELPESIEVILQDKFSRRVMEKFRKNDTNLIVASSVLEEGIDVQSCNLVVALDTPKQFSSYVQTKGRARSKTSQYIVFIESNERERVQSKIKIYKEIEQKLKECLVGKTINRQPPLEAEVAKELYDELIPPFRTTGGAILTALAAMQLLNRYAMLMPHDRFTNTSVMWEPVERDFEDRRHVARLYLPLQSTIKEPITSAPMLTLRMAKRCAAFMACRQLYLNGELNEHLMPIDDRKKMISLDGAYFDHWKQFPDDNKNPKMVGTRKHRRTHDLVFPEEFLQCSPRVGATCYVYPIRVRAAFDRDALDVNASVFHDLLNSDNTFALLTTKRLPRLAAMRFFFSVGGVDARVPLEPHKVVIDSEEKLLRLRHFHVMLFRDILRTWKDYFIYDFVGEHNASFFVAPLAADGTIDWPLVENFQSLPASREPPLLERRRRSFRPEEWRYKVVQPWYRIDKSQLYVVTEVREDLSPLAPFPSSDKAPTYEAYFRDKYEREIVHKDQFLIAVKGISTSLNCLAAGAGEKGASKRQRAGAEIYIPELCHNFEFPGDMWLKAIVTLNAIHRVHFLLLAERLRLRFVREMGIGTEDVEPAPVDTEVPSGVQAAKDDSASDEDDEEGAGEKYPSITVPNPTQVQPKDLPSELDSICNRIDTVWDESQEPVDFDRHWDNVFPFELDYYVNFISQRMETLSLQREQERNGITDECNVTAIRRPTLALADLSDAERFRIALLSRQVSQGVEQRDILKAITAASAKDVFDMERFEILGDSFLKFGVSFFLLHRHQEWHEGFLSAAKGRLVSNRNLFYLGVRAGLPGMIKQHCFDPRNDWTPPLLSVPPEVRDYMVEGRCSPFALYKLTLRPDEVRGGRVRPENLVPFMKLLQRERNTARPEPSQQLLFQQAVADKTVADCMEALLGVCLYSAGIEASLRFLPHFGILPHDDDLVPRLIRTRLASPRMHADTTEAEIDEFLINYPLLEQNLGYTFRDRAYLLQALTHASYPTNRITGCYQQLEFLGDAVLDFLVSTYIFERCDYMDPGQLTDLRSALVNNSTLACITVRNNFHLFLLAQNIALSETIAKFVAFQERHGHRVTDTVQLLVTETDIPMAEIVDVPKVLGDIFESLVGAVFLDSGNSLETTWRVIYRLMHAEINEFIRDVPKQLVRRLHEVAGANPHFQPAIVEEDVVQVGLRFSCKDTVYKVYGFGQNSDDAKKAAAKIALQMIQRGATAGTGATSAAAAGAN